MDSGISLVGAKASFNYGAYGVLYNWAAAQATCPAAGIYRLMRNGTQSVNYLRGKSVVGA